MRERKGIGAVPKVATNSNADGLMTCTVYVRTNTANGDGTLWISHSIQGLSHGCHCPKCTEGRMSDEKY